MGVDVLMPNLNINVVSKGEPEQYAEIPLVLESKCPELPFPSTFIGVSILPSFLSLVDFLHKIIDLPHLV